MAKYTVYHNPKCSKSRQAIQFLTEQGHELEEILYLKTQPTKKELTEVLKKLGISAEDLVRKQDAFYKELELKTSMSQRDWLDLLVKHPRLIERPIVIKDSQAVIARPTERILELK